MPIDSERLNAFLGKAVGDLGAATSATLVVLGDRLGLYKALAPGAKPRYDTIFKVTRALGIRLHAEAG